MAERRSTDAEHGFDEVFETCWLSTFRFALAWTNDWPAAEDIAQEAFARLWTKRETVDWSKPMLPWLLQVSRRLATDRFRRLLRSARLTDGPASTALDADARLRWLDVRAAMASLTPPGWSGRPTPPRRTASGRISITAPRSMSSGSATTRVCHTTSRSRPSRT